MPAKWNQNRIVINNEILNKINQQLPFDVIITKHIQPVIYVSLKIYLFIIFHDIKQINLKVI